MMCTIFFSRSLPTLRTSERSEVLFESEEKISICDEIMKYSFSIRLIYWEKKRKKTFFSPPSCQTENNAADKRSIGGFSAPLQPFTRRRGCQSRNNRAIMCVLLHGSQPGLVIRLSLEASFLPFSISNKRPRACKIDKPFFLLSAINIGEQDCHDCLLYSFGVKKSVV